MNVRKLIILKFKMHVVILHSQLIRCTETLPLKNTTLLRTEQVISFTRNSFVCISISILWEAAQNKYGVG